jgi:hypothetical protein
MNAEFEDWVNDVEDGPFVVRTNGGNVLVEIEIKALSNMAAAMLRHKVGQGSPTTCERYIRSRHYGSKPHEPGELEVHPDLKSALTMVRYRGKNRFIEEGSSE